MIESDKMQFAQMMAALDVLYGKESSKVKAQLFWEGLENIPLEVVRRGYERIKLTLDRYPSIAKWRQCCELEARDDDKKKNADMRHRLQMMAAQGPAVNTSTGEVYEPVYNCLVCEDRGWAYFETGTMRQLQFQETVGLAQDQRFVRRCTCGHFQKAGTARPSYAHIPEEREWSR
jgi:hypothetical protein